MCEECEREFNEEILRMGTAGGRKKRDKSARLAWLSADMPPRTTKPTIAEIHRARHGAPPPEGIAHTGAALPGGSITDGTPGPRGGYELGKEGERYGEAPRLAPKKLEMKLATGEKPKLAKPEPAPAAPAPIEAAPAAPAVEERAPEPMPAPATAAVEISPRVEVSAREHAPEVARVGVAELLFGRGGAAALRAIGFVGACAAIVALALASR